ncbi:hypothetical protein V8E53_001653 [Lactarius tabidus]
MRECDLALFVLFDIPQPCVQARLTSGIAVSIHSEMVTLTSLPGSRSTLYQRSSRLWKRYLWGPRPNWGWSAAEHASGGISRFPRCMRNMLVTNAFVNCTKMLGRTALRVLFGIKVVVGNASAWLKTAIWHIPIAPCLRRPQPLLVIAPGHLVAELLCIFGAGGVQRHCNTCVGALGRTKRKSPREEHAFHASPAVLLILRAAVRQSQRSRAKVRGCGARVLCIS